MRKAKPLTTARIHMRILLINHYAGSTRHGMEYRPYYLAREWSRHGHDVTILAASESHVRTVRPGLSGRITHEQIDGIQYVWLKTPPYQGNGVARTLNMLSFVQQLYRRASALVRQFRPDVVIASSTYPLDNVPARRIASRAGAKLVYEVHDLWPLSPIELGGMSPRHPFIRVMQWAENYAYTHADRVISMLPNAWPHMESHGMAPEKYAVVPNGIDPDEWDDGEALPQVHSEAIECARERARFLVGYAGAHGIANAMETVVDAARMLRDEGVEFVLVGQGPEKERLRQRACESGATNVLFLPPIPKNCVGSFFREMDVLYVGLRRTPIFRFGISPNKLMDYMMAAKPVILSVEAGNDLVADSRCGWSISPESPEALARAVRDAMRQDGEELRDMGARGREYVLEHHDYRVLAQRFIDAVT
jgi:glycosyltransferase involved in cell wall biosynthesis